MLIFAFISVLVACSSDEGNELYKLVDGVNVTTGKKIVQLTINHKVPIYDRDTIITYNVKINYDSKGRLSRIIWINGHKYENNKYLVNIDFEVIKIDYDFKMISFNWGKEFNLKDPIKKDYFFKLNKEGYISQIGDCSLTYDDYGYLIGVENTNYAWTLAYDKGEFIKSLVRILIDNKASFYYMFYGSDTNKGDLYFTLNTNSTNKFPSVSSVKGVMCFIAYQAGLFGKITTHCQYLSNSNETTATLQRHSKDDKVYKNEQTDEFVCSFVLE